MTEQKQEPTSKPPIPSVYWVGQDLDWDASAISVELRVELPYWLMVPDCSQDVQVHGHTFKVDIKENYIELYPAVVTDSRNSCVYIGPPIKAYPPKLQELVEKTKVNVVFRKCKTVFLIHSQCNKDVLAAFKEEGKRKNSAYLYLRSFCEAHFEIINRLIQNYRLATYDYFAFELSTWDVPIWFVGSGGDCAKIILQDYAGFDDKPVIGSVSGGTGERYKLIESEELQKAMAMQPSAGEFELQDALNFMERGDYSDAVRRITTAI